MSLAADLLKLSAKRQPIALDAEPPRPLRKRVDRTGIPRGIYRRTHGKWHVRDVSRSQYKHLGIYLTLREACEALARYSNCAVLDLPGITPEMWEKIKNEPCHGQVIHYKKPENVLSVKELKKILEYRDGNFYWKKNRRKARAGQIAGSVRNAEGDRRLRINKLYYSDTRLCWYWHSGEWPQHNIQKIVQDGGIRIENLFMLVDGVEIYGADLVK